MTRLDEHRTGGTIQMFIIPLSFVICMFLFEVCIPSGYSHMIPMHFWLRSIQVSLLTNSAMVCVTEDCIMRNTIMRCNG